MAEAGSHTAAGTRSGLPRRERNAWVGLLYQDGLLRWRLRGTELAGV